MSEDIFSYTKITEAVENNCGHNWLVMLNIQYRMHRDIAKIVNQYMYSGLLETADVIYESRRELAECEPMSNHAISMIDLSSTYSVCIKTNQGSRINLLSAMICMRIAEKLLDKYEVGIITPYSAQARLILAMIRDLSGKDSRYSRISSATVHQFQGSEKPVIIYDSVDCFRMPYPGVLLTGQKNNSANRLFNVALTRAQGKFILVGNRDFMYRKRISTKLIFTKVMDLVKDKKAVLFGNELIDEVKKDGVDCKHEIFLDNYENSFQLFCNDLESASKEITIVIPGLLMEDDEALDKLSRILIKKQESGVKISIHLDENMILPEELQQFVNYGYTTTPVTIVDKAVVWFGQPLSAAEFMSENDILETEYFPCLRMCGEITARLLRAFLEI